MLVVVANSGMSDP